MNLPHEFVRMPDRCPGQINWHYERAEIIADGAAHVIGVCLGFIGAVTLVVMAVKIERINMAPVLVYVIGLVTMLAFSAAYNMWPVSPAKWVLRRFDHSAIYLLIAATYTPFLAQMKNALASAGLGIGVWLSAAVGMALKLALPGRFDRLAIILCLLLGWSGVICLRLPRICHPQLEPMASRDRGHSTRWARSFMSGSACAFTTRSGMVLCCSRQVAIIRQSSLACPGNKRPVPRAHSRNRLDSDRAGRRRSGSCRRSSRRSSRLRRGRCRERSCMSCQLRKDYPSHNGEHFPIH
jgi:channel protein (hemolysin III family)